MPLPLPEMARASPGPSLGQGGNSANSISLSGQANLNDAKTTTLKVYHHRQGSRKPPVALDFPCFISLTQCFLLFLWILFAYPPTVYTQLST